MNYSLYFRMQLVKVVDLKLLIENFILFICIE